MCPAPQGAKYIQVCSLCGGCWRAVSWWKEPKGTRENCLKPCGTGRLQIQLSIKEKSEAIALGRGMVRAGEPRVSFETVVLGLLLIEMRGGCPVDVGG